ncbi:WD40-repeat-containing domain protein [Pisolithus croceorrhizus]|nr:WD40-repeat-containing domain protein [Pisolithus croceorrhizus]
MSDSHVDDIHDNVTSLSISPDGKEAAFGDINGTLTLWHINRRRHICAPVMAHQSIITSICYSADGRLVASASDDEKVGLWDAITGQSLRSAFTSHADGVLAVGFMTDSRTVVSLSRDGAVFVWKATTGEVEQQFRISLDARSLARLSNDGERLLAAHRSGITVWNTITMESTVTIALEGPMVLCMALSQDTTKAAFGMGDNSVHLWDLENNEAHSPHLEGGTELPLYVAWSPDGRTVSSVAQDGTLRVWSVESQTCMSQSHRTMGPITYSPGGSLIVCPGDDGFPDTWQVPQMLRDPSTFLLDLPAAAAPTHPTARVTESDALGGTSGDIPAMSAQHAQPQSSLPRNMQSKIRTFFSGVLLWLSACGKGSGEIVTRCDNLLWPLGRAVVLRCWVLRLGVCPPSLSFRAARRAVADDDLNLPYAVLFLGSGFVSSYFVSLPRSRIFNQSFHIISREFPWVPDRRQAVAGDKSGSVLHVLIVCTWSRTSLGSTP